MTDKSGRCRGNCTPPETADTISFDAVAEQGGPAGPLGLKRGFERVDRREKYSKASSTSYCPFSRCVYLTRKGNATYQREAKIVLMGEGNLLKYGFDWSNASIPALAAVSPNLATGPLHNLSFTLVDAVVQILTLNERGK